MKKVKTYGPANDVGVPETELDAAKLVQNAKAYGMSWTAGAFYRDALGRESNEPATAKFCCAIGAAELEPDTIDMNVDAGANDEGNLFFETGRATFQPASTAAYRALLYREAMQ